MTDEVSYGSSVPEGSRPIKLKGKPCPICGKAAAQEILPFCSKRCADVDLHRWLGGAYAIPVSEEEANPSHTHDDDSQT